MIGATDPLNHQSTFAYNAFGQMISATDALNNKVQFGYTGGDLTSVIDPMGNQSTNAYDAVGRVVSTVDPLGNVSSTQYNNLNLVTQVTDAAGNNTTFAYDPNGNLLSLTDALNHTTSWTYDNRDRVITRTDQLNRQESYTYDANNNLVNTTDRKGHVTSFTYDPLNRLKLAGYNTVVNGGNTTYESTTAFTYDAGNRITQAVDSLGGTITEVYDNLDRLTTETTAQGSVKYGYDNVGRRTSMTVGGQPQASYTFDNADRLTQITQGSSNVGFSYDNANRHTSLTLPNGVSVAYGYDNNSRLTGITYNFGANTLGNLTYAYDQFGRRTQVGGSFARTNLPGAVTSAAYDAANELTNWNGTAISYDANGNMLSDGSNTFTWNARDQVAILNGVSLQYDAFGRRIKNRAGASFLFDGSNSEQELAGSTVTANLWTGGIDELFQRSDSNGTITPLTDALGSTIALVNSSGSIITTYSYDPFGNTTVSGAASANPSQYTGRENEGNGLYYYRNRYYSPVLHRFVSEDPLGFGGDGTNFYTYVQNSVTNLVDPTGLVGSHKGFDNAWNQARAALSNPDCAAFLKKLLVNLHLAPDLDAFLYRFDQVNFLPTPRGDPNYKKGWTAHGDSRGDSDVVHVDRPWRSNLPETMLHEVFHTVFYGKSDYQMAVAADYKGPDNEDKASDYFSRQMEQHCHSDNCKNKKTK